MGDIEQGRVVEEESTQTETEKKTVAPADPSEQPGTGENTGDSGNQGDQGGDNS